MTTYNEEKIRRYFARKLFKDNVSRADCDAMAEKIVGLPVNPTSEQGLCSYTVLAGPKQNRVVQFREETLNKVCVDDSKQAWEIHGDIVPLCTLEGKIGELTILCMPMISGEVHSEKCYKKEGRLPAGALESLQNTTRDLAHFYAQSWNAGQKGRQDEEFAVVQRHFCIKEIEKFTENLPIRFNKFLKKIRSEMHLMFDSDYPYVMTHLDMLPWNILVDEHGHITGVIDWWDCKIMPFGVAIQGMFFNLLGWMDKQNWQWHTYEEHAEIEKLFWFTYDGIAGPLTPKERRAMEVTQMVGYFLRFGSTWDESIGETGDYRPTREGEEKMHYLDAVVKWTLAKKDSRWSQE